MDIDSLHVGDCLDILKSTKSQSIDLVYIDPPFFSQNTQKAKTRDNTQEYCFPDTWEDIEAYKAFMKPRLEECKRVLKETGSIFYIVIAQHHITYV